MTAASPIAGERAGRRRRRTWPPVLVLSTLALVALTALPLLNGGSRTSVRIEPAGPLLPPASAVIGDTPPAAVEPGAYAGDAVAFRVNAEQTGMEDIRVATRCGPGRLGAVTIAADGSFGATAVSAHTQVSFKGRFVRPDIAHGIARVQLAGCASGNIGFSARLRP